MTFHLKFAILLLAGNVILTTTDNRDKFPEWLVMGKQVVTLPCTSLECYPFNDICEMMNVQWILPRTMNYLHIEEGKVLMDGYLKTRLERMMK